MVSLCGPSGLYVRLYRMTYQTDGDPRSARREQETEGGASAAALDSMRRRASIGLHYGGASISPEGGAAMRTYIRLGLLLAVAGVVLVGGAETGASPAITERVSVSSAGVQGTSDSGTWGRPAISADGRYIAFESFSNNLVSGDTNNASDIFFRDRVMGTTTRVSLDSGGNQANGFSFLPAISSDGRFVAFESDATNLVSGDTNNVNDVFVRDRQTGVTTRVSVSSGGSEANGPSYQAAISSGGRYVAFYSQASNLVSGDSNNVCDTDFDHVYDDNCPDVFVHDRDTDTDGIFDESGAVSTTRISVSSGGVQGNGASFDAAISSDGRYVAFDSEASNLVSGDTNAFCDTDGDTVYDDNCPDVFVRDRDTDTDGIFDESGAVSTTRISVSSGGVQGNGGSASSGISSDGRYVVFVSGATNLVSGDSNSAWDVFVRDRDTDGDGIFDEPGAVSTTRVSVDSGGVQGNADSDDAAISSEGRYVAFASVATNLVSGDTNGAEDVFVHDRQTGATGRMSMSIAGAEGNGDSTSVGISANGRYIAFYSYAANLVLGDTNSVRDVFAHDRLMPVGGIAELPDVASHPGRSGGDNELLVALAAAAAVALTGGAWYARRRFGWRRLR